MHDEQIRAERRIRWVYGWLFVSIITFLLSTLCFISAIGFFYDSASFGVRTIATLLAALVFLILLLGLRSPYQFVRRHAQQALLLAALVTGLVWAFIGLELVSADVATLVILFAWLGGSFWGWQQVGRGDCWLMRVRGEGDQLPRLWATPEEEHPVEPVFEQNHIEHSPGQGGKDANVARLLTTFRNGSPEERQQAAAELEKLGEVEMF